MLLGIISDTHGHSLNTLDGIRILESMGVEQILHCGDIGSPAIPRLFTIPSYFVFGNVDRDEPELRAAIQAAGHTCCDRFGDLHLAGIRIALLHGDDWPRWESTVQSGNWQLVCSGHTHRREHRRVGTTVLLNPGAVFRATPHSVAVVELPKIDVQFLEF